MDGMQVLHAAWKEGNLLHIWSEIEDPGRGAKPAGGHPFAGDPARVRETLHELLPPSLTDKTGALPESEITLVLPTKAGKPEPSDERLEDGLPDGPDPGSKLAPWKVPGVAASAASVCEWLVGLPRKGEEPPGIAIGEDLRWYIAASRLSLDLIVRERYVPTPDGRWEPVLSAPGVFERCRHLALAMPDGGRSQPNATSFLTRSAVLRAFLKASVDGFVRARHEGESQAPGGVGRWLEALGPAGAPIPGKQNPLPASVPAEVIGLVQAWSGPAMTLEPYEGIRTCFSLEPPHHERRRGRGRGRQGPPTSPEWQLRFLLEPVGGPERSMPAAILWRNQVPIPQQRRPAAQDRFLADLVRANREFPPLTRALQEKLPRSVTLSVHEAYTFLTTVAPLLTESGTALQIPEELNHGRARIGVQVKLNPANGKEGFAAPVKVEYSLSAGDVPLSQQELQALIEARLPLVQIKGRWVELRPGDIKAAAEIINGKPASKPLAEALFGAWGEGETDGLPVMGVSASGWLEKLLGSDEARLEPVPVPKEFNGTLRPYQIRGLSWLDFLRKLGAGACLADDMGLGKTVQALALLLRHRSDDDRLPSLLIAPTSVLGNWEREAKRFAPDLKVLLHDGPDRAKGSKFLKAVLQHDLIVTSYALLNIDKDLLMPTQWDTVLLDEAQNIKNPHARQATAARGLNARYRIALTGTPVENRLSELWSIFEFLNPGYLGSLETFRVTLANPIERAHSKGHADRLRKLVQPFMLRRVKTDPGIAPELPEKIETTETCRLTKEQVELYQTVVKEMMKKIEDADGIERKGHVLAALTKLKQVCNHPAQAKKDNSRLPGRSGKLARLDELLEEIVEEGQRALVFTQYAEMAELLRRHLTKTLEADVLLLTGSTPREEREELIADFQDEDGTPKIFILSLKAGGTGLNLTAASHVLHFDRWWNPAVEAQATDRAYRIGQDKTVHVHAFVTAGTIEERVAAMLESKKSLAGKIVGTGEDWITELSTANLKDLFMLRAESLAEDE